MLIPHGLVPTTQEASAFVLHTIQHVCHVEFYAHRLQIGTSDPERPHDIVGPYNKFDWDVLCGLSLAYRDPSEVFREQVVVPARALHRCQYHHQRWNFPNESATEDDMKLGAIDAICSLLEPRTYQGGSHGFEKIRQIIDTNALYHQRWMIEIAKEIYQIHKLDNPQLDQITSLYNLPNIGLPSHTYNTITQRLAEVRNDLGKDHHIII